MIRKEKQLKKIKQIIIFAGNDVEVFDLTDNEKFISSIKEVKKKSKNMFIKIQKYKKNINVKPVVKDIKLTNIQINEIQKKDSSNIFNNLSDLILGDNEIFYDFEQHNHPNKTTHDKFKSIF